MEIVRCSVKYNKMISKQSKDEKMERSILLLIISVFFLLVSCDKSTEPEQEVEKVIIPFNRTFGGDDDDWGNYVQQTSDSGYIITGTTESYGSGEMDVWLIKTDENGNEEWTQTFGGSEQDMGRCVKQTLDGGYIIVGDTYSYGSGSMDIWLIKTSSTGQSQWTKTFGGTSSDNGRLVEQTSDGGYIIVGTTNSYGSDPSHVWLIKTNSMGDLQWSKTLGDGGDTGKSVQQTVDGGYFIVGTDGYNMSEDWRFSNFLLIKTSSGGDVQWSTTFNGGEGNALPSMGIETSNGYVIIGYDPSGPTGDVALIKINSIGMLEWYQSYDGWHSSGSVQPTSDGGYILARSDAFVIIKTDDSGNQEWRSYLNFSFDEIESVGSTSGSFAQETTDGGYILVGSGEPESPGGDNDDRDVILVKFDNEGICCRE